MIKSKKVGCNYNILNKVRFQNSIGLIHKVYLSQLKTSRNYTASTKTKSEVQGGGRKPWKQKGTGQARSGSIRSPLWVGGGVIFGPKPRVIFKKINKKEKTLAILFALYLKNCTILDSKYTDSLIKISVSNVNNIVSSNLIRSYNNNFSLDLFLKSKFILKILNLLKINYNSSNILFILDNYKKEFWLTTRNLKNIKISNLNTINLKEILNAEQIIIIT